MRRLLNCYGKATADEWLGVMRHAHRAGLRTTATMMYGTVETLEERIEHMVRLRELQDETGGFTAFITWSYQPEHTELGGGEATGVDYLRTLALARIVLDNFDNLQASWVTQGGKVGQLSLAYGANDMGSVMIEENVVRAAGASYCMDEIEIVRNVENAGFTAKRRNMHYEILGDPIFRERDVPRMLRPRRRARRRRHQPAAGDRPYAARSAAEKKARLTGAIDRFIAPPGCCPIAASADPRRLGRGRRRPDRRRRRRRSRPPGADAGASRRRPRRVAILPGARQRAHAPRAVVPARTGAAGGVVRRVGAALIAAAAQHPDPSAPRSSTRRSRGHRRGARGRDRRSSATSATPW